MTSPLGGKASRLKIHIKWLIQLSVGLLTIGIKNNEQDHKPVCSFAK